MPVPSFRQSKGPAHANGVPAEGLTSEALASLDAAASSSVAASPSAAMSSPVTLPTSVLAGATGTASGSPTGALIGVPTRGVLGIAQHTLPLFGLAFLLLLLSTVARTTSGMYLVNGVGVLLALAAAGGAARAAQRAMLWWAIAVGALCLVVAHGANAVHLGEARSGISPLTFLPPIGFALIWLGAVGVFAPKNATSRNARALESLLLSGAFIAVLWWTVLSHLARFTLQTAVAAELNLLAATFAGATAYVTLIAGSEAPLALRWTTGSFGGALFCAMLAQLVRACGGLRGNFWLDNAPGCAFVGLLAWSAWEAVHEEPVPTSAPVSAFTSVALPSSARSSRFWVGISALLDSTWPSGALMATTAAAAFSGIWGFKQPAPSLPGEDCWLFGLSLLAVGRSLLGAGRAKQNAERIHALEDDNARLGASVAEREAQIEALRNTSQDLNTGLNPAKVLSTGLDRAVDMLSAHAGALWLKVGFELASDSDSDKESTDNTTRMAPLQREFERMAVEQRVLSDLRNGGGGREGSSLLRKNELPPEAHASALSGVGWNLASSHGLEHSIPRSALVEAHAVLERESIEGLVRSCEVASSFGWVLARPIVWNGNVVGVVCVTRSQEFSDSERTLFEALSKEIGIALGNAQLVHEANRLADRDAVTDLLNHRAIQSQIGAQIARAQRNGNPLSIVMMDLNNFRFFNETYGHGAGDRVLRTVAACLREVCRLSDILGRFGGDEFVAVLTDTDTAGTVEVCARIAARLQRESYPDPSGRKIPITLAFGAAFYREDGEATSELLTQAASQLDAARHGGSHLGATDGDGSAPLRVEHLDSEEAREMRQLKQKGIGGSFGVLDALVTAIDNKDHYTRRHSEDVAHWAALIARKLGWNGEALRDVRMCGLLHDVGKIAVPDAILRKPGRLNDDEFNIMQQHPVFGALIVKDVPNLQDVLGGVRHHHERWDGKGYPDKLAGENIPLLGRILAVPDCFSAMTTDRPYRKALTWTEAMDEIKKGKGTQFDPQMADAFLEVMSEVLGSGNKRSDLLIEETPMLAPQVGDYLDATTTSPEGSATVVVPRSVADAKSSEPRGR